MKALLLAAGFGTRLRPITNIMPKCLVLVKEKPLLQYWLDMLLPGQVKHVLINTHYLSEKVEDFIGASAYANQISLVHEDELLGTGGTVLKNKDALCDGPFILAHADNLTRFNVQHFIDAHKNRQPGTVITMMTFDTDTPESCGIIEANDKGVVTAFYEKSKTFHGYRANAAVYIIEPSVIDFLASLEKEVIDFSTEVLPHYLHQIQIFHNGDYHRDIGTPESLALAQVEF